MHSISRRGFVISAAAAAATFGLDGPLEFIGPAFAQKPDPNLLEKGVVKFKVGDIEVIQMYDGTWEKAHDPGFVRNASLDDVKGALKAGGLTDAYVPVPFTVTAVRMGGNLVLFDSGKAEINPVGRAELDTLANALGDLEREIPTEIQWVLRVDGHTDKRPIQSPQFHSNWELSAARAIAVVQYLIWKGVSPQHLVAAGFGEFQPLDVGENDETYRRNRRIELKLTER